MGIKLKRLKAYRTLNDKTQTDMANLLDISLTSYSAKEQGRVDFTSTEIGIIAQNFKINPGELYSDNPTLNT